MSSNQVSEERQIQQSRTLEWPQTEQFYLTLDFECDFGTALSKNTYQAIDKTHKLIDLLETYDVPLTCFVQTELVDEKPEAVESLRAASIPVRFHPHSHTHKPRERASIENEVEISTKRFQEFFGQDPVGYRFPNGNIRDEDYRILAKYGYEFDASVFPSWRPNHFDNRSAPTVPQYVPEHDLFELPFTVYSDRIRIPTALSYNRLLRRPFGWLLTERPPPLIVYNIHMHDLVTPASFADLSRAYRLIYGQNDRGFELLEQVLAAFVSSEYSFGTLDEVHNTLRDTGSNRGKLPIQ